MADGGSLAQRPVFLLNSCNSCPASRSDEIVNVHPTQLRPSISLDAGDFERTSTFEAAKKNDPSIMPD
jgi:hypothetical protein